MRNFLNSLIFLVLLVLEMCFISTANVSGNSMYPTIEDGSFLILLKDKEVERGDIVSIYSQEEGKILCKRIIGIEGDHIIIKDGYFAINDELQNEDYIYEEKWGSPKPIDLVVGENEVFVMGDNRNNSLDSRTLGCLGVDQILGVLLLDVTSLLGLSATNVEVILCSTLAFIVVFSLIKNKRVKEKV